MTFPSLAAARRHHFHLAAQLGHLAHGVLQLNSETASGFGGLHLEHHLVVGHFTTDHEAGTLNLRKAFHDGVHLARMHKHTAHLGRPIRTPHPALDARVGAARGHAPGSTAEVARAKTDQRVVGVERGDHQLAHLASGTGSPVPGRTISTITPSSSTRPSRASVS
jgi:hypothetical protein